jgi:hypothetical protein
MKKHWPRRYHIQGPGGHLPITILSHQTLPHFQTHDRKAAISSLARPCPVAASKSCQNHHQYPDCWVFLCNPQKLVPHGPRPSKARQQGQRLEKHKPSMRLASQCDILRNNRLVYLHYLPESWSPLSCNMAIYQKTRYWPSPLCPITGLAATAVSLLRAATPL